MILEVVTIVEHTRHGSAPAITNDIIPLHLSSVGSVKISRYSILRLRIWTSRVFDRVYICHYIPYARRLLRGL
jgi:hypothetical protein